MNENINVDRLFLSRETKKFSHSAPPTSFGGFFDIDYDALPDNALSVCDAGYIVKFVVDEFSSAVSKPQIQPTAFDGVTLKMFQFFPFINSMPQCYVSFGGCIAEVKSQIPSLPASYGGIYRFSIDTQSFSFLTRPPRDWLGELKDMMPGDPSVNAVSTYGRIGPQLTVTTGIGPGETEFSVLISGQYNRPVSAVAPGVYYLCGPSGVYGDSPRNLWGGTLFPSTPIFLWNFNGNFCSEDGGAFLPKSTMFYGQVPDIASIPEIAKQTFPASWR